jgi:wobble nucleotide-excising tRNase
VIKKILKIQNVGRFDNYTPRGNVELGQFSLIFAENSRGKTTICDILRSLQSGDGSYIMGRRRLGSTGDTAVDILHGNGTAKFQNGRWNSPYPDVTIFDSTFVHQNVFSGDYVDHDHKRNLYRVIVGEKGVTLAKAIDDLDAKIKDAIRDIGAKRQVLEQSLAPGMALADFLALPPDTDIANKIQAKENEIATASTAWKRAGEIKGKGLVAPLRFPAFPASFKELLNETLATISRDAETQIQKHVTDHTAGATQEWISRGIGYIKGDDCPLCGQKMAGLELVSAYRAVFDAKYQSFKKKFSDFGEVFSSQFGSEAFQPIQRTASANAVLATFWAQFESLALPADFMDDARAALLDLSKHANELLQRKAATPLEPVPLTTEFDAAFTKYAAFSTAFETYNAEVARINEKIGKIKSQASAADPAKLKKELEFLGCVQKRHDVAVAAVANEYARLNAAKTELDAQKANAKTELDEYSDAVLKNSEKRINELLGMFGAGFRIGNTKRSYVGARVSSSYHIVINGHAVELGDSATPAEKASFRNTLSAGDKSTLALIFFIVQAEGDPNLPQKTLIFDDPFTSQDRSRRTCTQQFLCKLAKQAKQVIVLSHDPYFLRSVWDESPRATVKTLQLGRMGSASATLLLEWDIENETRGEYAKSHRVLWDYAYIGKGDNRAVAQTIRPVLEKYLRLKVPYAFADNEWLGDFIAKIRNADATSPLDAAKVILAELGAINDFSKKYHHAQNAHADTEPIDSVELETFVKRTLDLVGGF